MIKGPDLRGHVNRKLKFDGEYQVDKVYRNCIYLPIEEGQRAEYQAGETIALQTSTKIKVHDRVLAIHPHPALYDYGLLSFVPHVDESMDWHQVKIRFEADEDIDLIDIPWLCKLYILG